MGLLSHGSHAVSWFPVCKKIKIMSSNSVAAQLRILAGWIQTHKRFKRIFIMTETHVCSNYSHMASHMIVRK